MSNTTWNIVTYHVINDRDMTIGICLENTVWNQITSCQCLKSHNKQYASSHPAGKGLFNLSKIMNKHRPSHLCPNIIFLTLGRFLSDGYKQKNLLNYSKDVHKRKNVVFSVVISQPTNQIEFNLTYSTFHNPYFAKFLQHHPPWFSTKSFSHIEYICFS